MLRHKPGSCELNNLPLQLTARGPKDMSAKNSSDRSLAILDKKDQSLKPCLPFSGPKANQHQETGVCMPEKKGDAATLSEGTVISRAFAKNQSAELFNYSITFCHTAFRAALSPEPGLTELPSNSTGCILHFFRWQKYIILAGTIPERVGLLYIAHPSYNK